MTHFSLVTLPVRYGKESYSHQQQIVRVPEVALRKTSKAKAKGWCLPIFFRLEFHTAIRIFLSYNLLSANLDQTLRLHFKKEKRDFHEKKANSKHSLIAFTHLTAL
jgi:hypothetical protein